MYPSGWIANFVIWVGLLPDQLADDVRLLMVVTMHPDDRYIAGVISQSLVLLIGSVGEWWNHHVTGESLIISGYDGHNRGFYPPLAPGSHPPRDGSQVLGISRISHGAVHGQWIGWPILLPAVNPSQRYFGNLPQHRSPWYYGCQNVQKTSQRQSFWAHLMCCFHTFHGTPLKDCTQSRWKTTFKQISHLRGIFQIAAIVGSVEPVLTSDIRVAHVFAKDDGIFLFPQLPRGHSIKLCSQKYWNV